MSYTPMIIVAGFVMAALLVLALTPTILHRLETRRQVRRSRRRKS